MAVGCERCLHSPWRTFYRGLGCVEFVGRQKSRDMEVIGGRLDWSSRGCHGGTCVAHGECECKESKQTLHEEVRGLRLK